MNRRPEPDVSVKTPPLFPRADYWHGMHLCLSVLLCSCLSVDPLPAVGCSTVAGNLVLVVRRVELVVKTQLENNAEYTVERCVSVNEEKCLGKKELTSSPFSTLRLVPMMIL